MLDATMKQQLGTYLELLRNPIELTVSTDNSAKAQELVQLANQIAQMPTRALGLTKKLLNESFRLTLEEQLLREKQLQVEAGNTQDFKEGVQAFLEKRKPVFKGA